MATTSPDGASVSSVASGGYRCAIAAGTCRHDPRLPDNGVGSAALITGASAGDTIAFNCASATTIAFSSAITITQNVSLDASGATGQVAFDGGGSFGLLVVNSGVTLSLTSLTLIGGSDGTGGGAVDNHGTLNVTRCTFSSNTTPGGGGGAIFSENNAGPLTVTNSTFSGNTAFVEGGAIDVYNADMHISNSTFSNNSAGTEGGAIRNQACCVAGNTISNSTFSNNSVYGAGGQGGAVYDTGPLAITNSTVSGNSASAAGSIYFHASFVTLGGDIIANSTNGNCGGDGGGGFTDSGYNLADDNGSTCGLSVANNDVLNVNPMLMALADNGGPNGTRPWRCRRAVRRST